MASLSLFERQRHILAQLQQEGRVSVSDLSDHFGVSTVTIRADLSDLEERGALARTHGGAVLLRPRIEPEPAFAQRRMARSEEKQRMGGAAAALVQDGEAIALDASTSALAIAGWIKGRRELTVVTNGLMIAIELADAAGVSVVMPGGILRGEAFSLVSDMGNGFLTQLNISKGFFGARGLTVAEGLSDADNYEVEMKRCLVAACKEVTAVVDSSKWGHLAVASFAPTERLDRIITDRAAPSAMVEQLRGRGVEVILV
ncbi:MAG TPA: DeoR/GlpR family DNA-binding transcription regulator [Anaerolineae bacterium]|nr:DeoR/GlpR family DNA-binding transcription regulator [Anaerolineae bacterium]